MEAVILSKVLFFIIGFGVGFLLMQVINYFLEDKDDV
jgi:hypothetical protein